MIAIKSSSRGASAPGVVRQAISGSSLVKALGSDANAGTRQLICAEQISDTLLLRPACGHELSAKHVLPLLNAKTCPVCDPRTVELPRRKPHVSLAACVVVECNGNVLLTRRQPKMRSFPGCWVFPGGGVEEGETAMCAALRELREETGLVLEGPDASLNPLCFWESCYPTTYEGCAEVGRLLNHHLVVFFVVSLSGWRKLPKVELQSTETDMAVWLPLEINLEGSTEELSKFPPVLQNAAKDCCDGVSTVELIGLVGIYREAIVGESNGGGTGEGHLAALRELRSRMGKGANRLSLLRSDREAALATEVEDAHMERYVFGSGDRDDDYDHLLSPLVHADEELVDLAFGLAQLHHDDILLDLGCGDGRVVMHAVSSEPSATSWQCRFGVGVDIDGACIAAAKSNSATRRLGHRTLFRTANFAGPDFWPAPIAAETDGSSIEDMACSEELAFPSLASATVVYIYLVEEALRTIRPFIERALTHPLSKVRAVVTCTYHFENWGTLTPTRTTLCGRVKLYSHARAAALPSSPSQVRSLRAVSVSRMNAEYGDLFSATFLGSESDLEDVPGWLCPFLQSSIVRIRRAIELLPVEASDHMLDIGSGNGAALIEAACRTGCRCTGIEIDRGLVDSANAAANARGVSDRCHFICADAVATLLSAIRGDSGAATTSPEEFDISSISVVMLYLVPAALKALKELIFSVVVRSGARLVTLEYHFPDVAYDRADPDFDISVLDSAELLQSKSAI